MLKAILAALLLAASLGRADATALTACQPGVTDCSNDTTNAAIINAAINDTATQNRVWNLWNGQCQNIYSEAGSTPGHTYRVNFCQSIAAVHVPMTTLVSAIMNPTVQSEVLGASVYPPYAGNMVDADVNTAIDGALTVNTATAQTTATQTTVGSNNVAVASATGIFAGQQVSCPGCPNNAVVTFVSGTTVVLSGVTTASIPASTPILFYLYTGLPTRAW